MFANTTGTMPISLANIILVAVYVENHETT